MTPLFKTQYSIGKSLLKVEDLVDIYSEGDLDVLHLVEDSFCGFREIERVMGENKIPFAFGLRLDVVQEELREEDLSPSKLVFFAKNKDGLVSLKDIYTKAKTSDSGFVVMSDYSREDFRNVKIMVPFYDSYICKNIFHFGMVDIDLDRFDDVIYSEEDNLHPFDFQIKSRLSLLGVETAKTKTIYHKLRDDFHAFQMLKAVCARSQGRSPVFSNPNLNDFCSEEFCWESYLDQCKS